jgi:hypothetical protein
MTDAARPKPEIITEPDEAAPAAAAPEIIYLPRPKKKEPPRRRRARHVFVRLDDAEFTELETRAREAGLSVGAFCRLKTLDDPGPRSKRAPPTAQDQLTAAHHIAVKRIGVNVNQGIHSLAVIALAAPQATSRDRLADEIMAVREMLRAMQRTVDDVLAASRAALGR